MEKWFATLHPHVLNVFISPNSQNISQIKTNSQTKATLYHCLSTPDSHCTDGLSQNDEETKKGMEGKLAKVDWIWTGGAVMDDYISELIPKFLDGMMGFLLKQKFCRMTIFGGERPSWRRLRKEKHPKKRETGITERTRTQRRQLGINSAQESKD